MTDMVTIKIHGTTKEKLDDLIRRTNRPAQDVIEAAIIDYIYELDDEVYAELQEDQEEWLIELRRRFAWNPLLSRSNNPEGNVDLLPRFRKPVLLDLSPKKLGLTEEDEDDNDVSPDQPSLGS